MTYELIISEKPNAAKKIAEALADKTPVKRNNKKVSYFELKHKGKSLIVACAVGHLYNVSEKNKNGWTYPTYDLEWKESHSLSKNSKFNKIYLDTLKKLAKDANEFTVACDYDIEGEVIGLNIIRLACKQKDAKRMKFSTLTKDELIDSYEHASKHLNWPQAEAGETRHFLDYLWGINLSRALTLAIRNATNRFKVLSSGRVQGPALKILAERELEINKFKSEPYWQIEAKGKIDSWHVKDKFFNKEEASKIYNKIKNEKKAIVKKIEKQQFNQAPPNPFDLTALQLEAYNLFKINPKDTLAIAQELYTSGCISYPRTSSNQLPESINYAKIIKLLSKQEEYASLCQELLKKKILKPNNGKKTDPAHPAIYPTGEIPEKLKDHEKRIYSLIVRRTLASFSEPALRETNTIKLSIKDEPFTVSGTVTIEKGWHVYYGPFARFKEEELPKLKENEEIKINKIILHEDKTKPPKRYNPASIIKELEKRNLGTKSTRAAIIDSLYERNYLKDQTIEVTDLGIKTVETLKKYCPEILDEELTRTFEEDMEAIIERKITEEKILERAKKELDKILKHFKENEIKIGKSLSEANQETMEKESYVGACPVCKKGSLKILYSRKFKSKFIACDQYPKCKTTFSIPYGLAKTTEKFCESCNYPMLTIIRKGKRPFDYCINKSCPKKKEWIENQTK